MEKIPCIVGIDFGTTNLSCVVIDVPNRSIRYTNTQATLAAIPFADKLRKEQSLSAISDCFYRLLAEVSALPGIEIGSVGLTGQMHGIIGLDRQLRPVTNLVTWQDRCGEMPRPGGKTLLQEMAAQARSPVFSTGYGVVTLYKWLRVERLESIHTFCTLPDYFGALLTQSSRIRMDYSMAGSLGCFSLPERTWDKRMIDALQLDRIAFPEVVRPMTVLGEVRDDRRLKFSGRGVPVSVAIGDNQASFVGSATDVTGTLLINIGTAAQLCYAIPVSEPPPGVDGPEREVRPLDDDFHLRSINLTNGGNAYRVLYDFFLDCGAKLFGLEPADLSSRLWETMLSAASAPVDAGGLRVSPLFDGTRRDARLRGSIQGISADNFRPAELIVATLRGLAESCREMLDEEVRRKPMRLVGSGNAIKKNPVLVRLLAEAFGREIHLTAYDEEAAVGAAVHGAVSGGILERAARTDFIRALSVQ